jgi:hypothetical protein
MVSTIPGARESENSSDELNTSRHQRRGKCRAHTEDRANGSMIIGRMPEHQHMWDAGGGYVVPQPISS